MGLVVGVCWYCSLSHIDIASALLARFFLRAGVFQDFDSQNFSKFFKDFDFQISWSSLLWTGTSLSLKFYWAIPEKIQTGGLEDILFWKNSWNLFFFTLTPEIPDRTKLNLWIFLKIVLDLLEIPRQKQKTLEILSYFFLVTLGNSTSFLINPWKFHMLFPWYPWKFHILNLLFLDFFLNSPLPQKLATIIPPSIGSSPPW